MQWKKLKFWSEVDEGKSRIGWPVRTFIWALCVLMVVMVCAMHRDLNPSDSVQFIAGAIIVIITANLALRFHYKVDRPVRKTWANIVPEYGVWSWFMEQVWPFASVRGSDDILGRPRYANVNRVMFFWFGLWAVVCGGVLELQRHLAYLPSWEEIQDAKQSARWAAQNAARSAERRAEMMAQFKTWLGDIAWPWIVAHWTLGVSVFVVFVLVFVFLRMRSQRCEIVRLDVKLDRVRAGLKHTTDVNAEWNEWGSKVKREIGDGLALIAGRLEQVPRRRGDKPIGLAKQLARELLEALLIEQSDREAAIGRATETLRFEAEQVAPPSEK